MNLRLSQVVTSCLVAALVAVACSKVPIIGRHQFNLIPDSIMNPIGQSSYQSMLSTLTLQNHGETHQTLSTVGGRIARVANQEDYDWEFSLIRDEKTINAWCLPGGKVAVYSGLLPVVRTEAALAAVVGHEVGHATAHHSAERLTQQLTLVGGLVGLNYYLDKKSDLSSEQRTIILAAIGLGAEVGVILPFSRRDEYEADVIGMMYMARAGYPPTEALEVWNRMEAAGSGSALPAFLSTHPSNEDRKANLRDWMPKAKARYQRNSLERDTTATIW